MSALSSGRWIDRGKPLPSLGPDYFKGNLNLPFRYFALVQVRSTANTTEVRWDPAHADWASIDAAVAAVMEVDTSTTLVFYKSGWFKEHYSTASEAAARIYMVQTMKDVDLAHAAFVKPLDYSFEKAPPLIKLMMQNPYFYANHAIEHWYNEADGTFDPSWSGPESATTKVFGPDWIERGSLAGSERNREADDELVREYQGVLDDWTPRYDQILVALAPDDEEHIWVPYHRVMVPRRARRGGFGTSNLIALGKVDLAPLGSSQCVW